MIVVVVNILYKIIDYYYYHQCMIKRRVVRNLFSSLVYLYYLHF